MTIALDWSGPRLSADLSARALSAMAAVIFSNGCESAPRLPEMTLVLAAPFEEREPAPSPDGRRLAFLADSDEDRANELWISGSDGADPQRVAFKGALASAPAWRPDGKRLVAAITTPSGAGALVDIDPESGEASPMPAAGVDPAAPSLSRDGKLLTYAARPTAAAEFAIWLASASGEDARIIAPSPERSFWPRFSPDGGSITFFSRRDSAGEEDDVYSYDIASGALARLTQRRGHDFTPAPAPDGKYLAYVTNGGGEPALHVLHLPSMKDCRFSPQGRAFAHPSWSADGELLFATVRSAGRPSDIAVLPFSPRRFQAVCAMAQDSGG